MGGQDITKLEFLMLAIAGLLLALSIAIAVQLGIYARKNIPQVFRARSSVVVLIGAPILGVFFWLFIPILTEAWQQLVFWFHPNPFSTILGLVPVFPMLIAVVLVSIPVTFWQVKKHGNA